MNSPEGKMKRVSQDVETQLVREILSGVHAAGEKLPAERTLAARYEVTRTSLREALRHLETMGLLNIRPGDGIYVCDYHVDTNFEFITFLLNAGIPLDKELTAAMQELRALLVSRMAGMAAKKADKTAVRALRDAADAYPEKATPEFLSGDADLKLLQALARATGNRAYMHLVNSTAELFKAPRWLASAQDDAAAQTCSGLASALADMVAARKRKKSMAIAENLVNLTQPQE